MHPRENSTTTTTSGTSTASSLSSTTTSATRSPTTSSTGRVGFCLRSLPCQSLNLSPFLMFALRQEAHEYQEQKMDANFICEVAKQYNMFMLYAEQEKLKQEMDLPSLPCLVLSRQNAMSASESKALSDQNLRKEMERKQLIIAEQRQNRQEITRSLQGKLPGPVADVVAEYAIVPFTGRSH